jgi:diacylglycerol kinase family enzyme
MGIIPRGTANAFSVALGIPTHIDDPQNFATQAAEVILQVRRTRTSCRQTVTSSHWQVGTHDPS